MWKIVCCLSLLIGDAALIFDVSRTPVAPILPVLHGLFPEFAANAYRILLDTHEVTLCSVSLRHSRAADAMRALAENGRSRGQGQPTVGASTCVSELQMREAVAGGAVFVSTVFTTQTLARTARELDVPLLAGVASLAEAEQALVCGAKALKFYPSSLVTPLQLHDILGRLWGCGLEKVPVYVAGGVRVRDMADYRAAGADGFAIGIDCSDLEVADTALRLYLEAARCL
jgi:2-keto-3-deoxy-6-phosphogluconate aldolase